MAAAATATGVPFQKLGIHGVPQTVVGSPIPCSGARPKWSSISREKAATGLKLVAKAVDLLGDFGARDPFPAEIESKFGEKVLGNYGTDHVILIPNGTGISLATKDCTEIPRGQPPMSHDEASALLLKIVGWRLLEHSDGLKLQCLWKVNSFRAGVQLIGRIASVSEAAGHYPDLHLESGNSVRATLWTPSVGGLSMNDFIMAAKIDQIKISDLIPRKRVWA